MTRASEKGRFLGGVTVLTVSTAAVKLIGLFYKIPLIRLVGIGGMAYFLAAYHIYTLLFMLSTSGLPVAVSILVARSRAEGKNEDAERIYRISLIFFSLIGVLCSALLYISADIAAAAVGIPEASHCIRAVASLCRVGQRCQGLFSGQAGYAPDGDLTAYRIGWEAGARACIYKGSARSLSSDRYRCRFLDRRADGRALYVNRLSASQTIFGQKKGKRSAFRPSYRYAG